MEPSKLNENKACLPGKKDNKHVDHITDIIGIFGPFHAVFYTAIGTVHTGCLIVLRSKVNGYEG